MQCEIRGMSDAKPRISDTLPRRGRVNEVCREWVVHEDEALAYQLQKQEVEQHYGGNKERNARVREDFPKAKEEQEKEILEAAEKYRQMVRQQEMIDSTYARRIAEKLEREELERRRRAEIHDQEVAKKAQVYEIVKNNHTEYQAAVADRIAPTVAPRPVPPFIPDVNRIGLPIIEDARFDSAARHHASANVTHSLRNLRLNDGNGSHTPDVEKAESCSSGGSNYSANYVRVNRTPTPATLLPEDLNEIITDADLQEEANRRLQEQKDAELAKMLQMQEEQIVNEEIDRDRLMAIEAQDKELAKLLYEKEKAKLKRAKERARQRALQKKQSQNGDTEVPPPIPEKSILREPCSSTSSEPLPSVSQIETISVEPSPSEEAEERRPQFRANLPTRTPPMLQNVAMHIDPTYLSQQSSSMPNSLIFQEGDNAAPPYMPIQGQRRNAPSSVEKKQKKSKSKDGCKQQ